MNQYVEDQVDGMQIRDTNPDVTETALELQAKGITPEQVESYINPNMAPTYNRSTQQLADTLRSLNNPVGIAPPMSKSDFKAAVAPSKAINKTQSVNAATERKKLQSDPQGYIQRDLQYKEQELAKELPLFEYLTSNESNLPVKERIAFYNQQKIAENEFRDTQLGYDFQEAKRDIAFSVGKGVANLINVVPAVGAAMGSETALEAMQVINQASQYLGEQQTPQMKAQRARLLEDYQRKYVNNRANEIRSGKPNNTVQDIGDFFTETGAVLSSIPDNPLMLLDIVFEEAPSLITGGLIGKKAADVAIKNVLKKQAQGNLPDAKAVQAFMASDVGKAVARKAATTAGVGTAALEEGSALAAESANEVMNMSTDELKQTSRLYNEYLKTMSPEQAKLETASTIAAQTLAVGAALSGVISKVSGAGEFTGNLFTGTRTGKITTNALKEGGEEFLQGSTTQAAANVLSKEQIDNTKEVREGLGLEAGLGLAAGGTLGGGATAVQNTLEDTGKAVSKSVDAVNKVTTEAKAKVAEGIKATTETEDTKAADEAIKSNTTESLYNEEGKATVPLKELFRAINEISKSKDVSVETKMDEFTKANDYRNSLIDEAETLAKQSEEAEEQGNIELANELSDRRLAILQSSKDASKLYDSALARIQNEYANSAAEEINEGNPSETTEQVKDAVLHGSMENPNRLPKSFVDAAANPESSLTDDERAIIQALAESKKVTQKLNKEANTPYKRKTMGKVRQDIMEGDGKFKGIKTHRQLIANAIRTEDKDAIASSIGDLDNFITLQSQKLSKLNQATAALNNRGIDAAQEILGSTFSLYKDATGKDINNPAGALNAIRSSVSAEVDALNTFRKEFQTYADVYDVDTTQASQEAPVETPRQETVDTTTEQELPPEASTDPVRNTPHINKDVKTLSDEELNEVLDYDLPQEVYDSLTEEQENTIIDHVYKAQEEAENRGIVDVPTVQITENHARLYNQLLYGLAAAQDSVGLRNGDEISTKRLKEAEENLANFEQAYANELPQIKELESKLNKKIRNNVIKRSIIKSESNSDRIRRQVLKDIQSMDTNTLLRSKKRKESILKNESDGYSKNTLGNIRNELLAIDEELSKRNIHSSTDPVIEEAPSIVEGGSPVQQQEQAKQVTPNIDEAPKTKAPKGAKRSDTYIKTVSAVSKRKLALQEERTKELGKLQELEDRVIDKLTESQEAVDEINLALEDAENQLESASTQGERSFNKRQKQLQREINNLKRQQKQAQKELNKAESNAFKVQQRIEQNPRIKEIDAELKALDSAFAEVSDLFKQDVPAEDILAWAEKNLAEYGDESAYKALVKALSEDLKSERVVDFLGDDAMRNSEPLTQEQAEATLTNKDANLVAEFFTYRKLNSVVHKLRGFFNSTFKDPIVNMFMGRNLYAEEQQYLDGLTDFVNNFKDKFKAEFKPQDFKRNDFVQYLYNEKTGEIDDSLLDIIALGAYDWVIDQSFNDPEQSEEGLVSLLGLDKGTDIPVEFFNKYKDLGTTRDKFVNTLGKSIRKQLNFSKTDQAPDNFNANLETALGGYAMTALKNMDLIERVDMDPAITKDAEKANLDIQVKPTVYKGKPQPFPTYRLKTYSEDGTSYLTQEILDMSDAFKDNRDLYESLFDVQFESYPAWKKPKVSNKVKKTDMVASDEQVKNLTKYSHTPHRVKQDIWNIIKDWERDDVLRLMQYDFDAQYSTLEEQKSIASSNRKIAKEVDELFKFIEKVKSQPKGMDSDFFFNNEFWSNGRMGMIGRLINPQNSHLHRHLLAPESHVNNELTVTHTFFGRPKGKLNDEQTLAWANVLAIKEALGWAFDIKMERTKPQEAIKQIHDILRRDDVKAIVKLIQGGINKDNAPKLVKGIEGLMKEGIGDRPIILLDALTNYANLTKAQAENKGKLTKIKWTAPHEIDGLNNGMFITAELLGLPEDMTEAQAKLIKGGANFDGIKESFGDNDTYDFYEELASKIGTELVDTLKELDLTDSKVSDAIFTLLGDIFKRDSEGKPLQDEDGNFVPSSKGRKFAKPMLTESNYGAGSNKVVTNALVNTMAGTYSAAFRELNKLVKTEPESEEAFEAYNKFKVIVDAVLELSGDVNGRLKKTKKLLDKDISTDKLSAELDDLAKFPLDMYPDNGKQIKQVADQIMLPAIEAGIQAQQGDTITNRNAITALASILVSRYRTMYNSLMQKEIDAMVERGVPKGLAVPSKAQIDAINLELEAAFPAFHNWFSQQSGNLNERTSMPDYKTTFAHKNKKAMDTGASKSAYTQELKLNSGNVTLNLPERVMVEGGVRSTPTGVQGVDAAIANELMAHYDGLNAHDAYYFTANLAREGSVKQNELTYNILTGYDLFGAVVDSYDSSAETYSNTEIDEEKRQEEAIRSLIGNHDLEEEGLPMTTVWVAKGNKRTVIDFGSFVSTLFKHTSNYDDKFDSFGQVKAQLHNSYMEFAQGYDINSPEVLAQFYDQLIETATANIKELAKENQRRRDSYGLIVATNVNQYALGGYVPPKSEVSTDGTEAEAVIEAKVEEQDNRDTFGSMESDEFDPESYTFAEEVNSTTAEGIFDKLLEQDEIVEVSEEQEATLRGLLNNMITKVLNPISMYDRVTEDETSGIADVTNNALYLSRMGNPSGVNPSSMVAGITMSQVEVYVHELIHMVTSKAIEGRSMLRNELSSLYEYVKSQGVPVTVFMNPSTLDLDPDSEEYQTELKQAQARHDYIFNSKPVTKTRINPITGRQDTITEMPHLHEFVAIGLTNENFRKHLETITVKKPEPRVNNGYDLVAKWFNNAMDFIFKLLTKVDRTKTTTASNLLAELANGLAHIEDKKKANLLDSIKDGMMYPFEQLNRIATAVKSGIGKGANKIKDSQRLPAVITAPAAIVSLAAEDKLGYLQEVFDKFRHTIEDGKQGFLNSMTSELLGGNERTQNYFDKLLVVNKNIDKARKQIKDTTASILLNSFTEMNPQMRKGILKAGIKTDIVSLIDFNGDMAQELDTLHTLLTSPTALNRAIANLQGEIAAFGDNQHYFTRHADNLGRYMATGYTHEASTLLNAHNIARFYDIQDTRLRPRMSDADTNRAEALIDKLASLWALKYTAGNHKQAMAAAIQQEASKDLTENGMVTTLKLHKDFKETALDANFQGQKALMIKGYTKEIVNPHIALEFATAEEEDYLANFGYSKDVGAIPRDEDDSNEDDIYVYVNKNMGATTKISGIMSMSNNTKKGHGTIDVGLQLGDTNIVNRAGQVVNKITHDRKDKILDMFNPAPNHKRVYNTMIPVVANNGTINDYRYTMKESLKDDILEKNNNFDEVLGAMMGAIQDKVMSVAENDELIYQLKDTFDNEYANNSEQFVEISPESDDSELAQIWYMIPEDTKETISDVWGGERIFVHRELVDVIFGYHKASLMNIWDIDPEFRTTAQKLVVTVAETFLGQKAPKYLRNAENILDGLVQMAKDNIVVKSLTTTFFNYMSNFVTLMISGVSIKDITIGHKTAIAEAKKYHTVSKEILELETLLKLNQVKPADKSKAQNRLNRLKAELASSPIHDLVEAGMLQTIVEDLGNEDGEEFAYKQKWQEAIDKKVDEYINPTVKKYGSEFFMLQGTKGYQFAHDMVQFSDFAAKYTLYTHLTKSEARGGQGMEAKEAFNYAMRLFINYDVPTHKYMQYANDKGLIWFTKYMVRNMRAIVMLLGDNPARSMVSWLFQTVFGNLADITDTILTPFSLMDRTNLNPLNHLTTIGDIAPLAATRSIL